jgi:GNAT superfamily N-acetyltransferase
MTIRPATIADLPWLRLLFTQLIAHGVERFPSPYPSMDDEEFDNFTRAMYRQLTINPHFGCWVADDGGTLVGFLAGEVWERAIGKPNRYGSPHYLYVDPQHRGRGVAPALIKAGVEWLRGQGITHVELAAWAGDPLWQRHGWQPYLSKFWLPLDAVLARRAPKPPPVLVPAKKRGRKKARPNGHAEVHT